MANLDRFKKFHVIGGYFASTAVVAIANFMTIPLCLRMLSKSEYGKWALLEPLILISSSLCVLGVNYGIIKQINQDKHSPFMIWKLMARRTQVSIVPLSLAFLLVSLVLGIPLWASVAFAVLVYLEANLAICMAIFRSANILIGYALGSAFKYLLVLVAFLFAIQTGRGWIHGVENVLFVWVFSSGLALVACWALFFYSKNEHVVVPLDEVAQAKLWPDAIRYGYPILVASIFGIALANADRVILKSFLSFEVVAMYAVYAKIANIINPIIISPLATWWPTERFRRVHDVDGGLNFFYQASLAIWAFLLILGSAIWVGSPTVLGFLAPGVAPAPIVMSLLIGSVVLGGIKLPLTISLLEENKTHWNIWLSGIAAMIQLVGCVALIPKHGMIGAALSTFLGSVSYVVLAHLVSQRIRWVPMPYFGMALLFGFSALLCWLMSTFGMVAGYLFEVAIFATYVVVSAIVCFVMFSASKRRLVTPS